MLDIPTKSCVSDGISDFPEVPQDQAPNPFMPDLPAIIQMARPVTTKKFGKFGNNFIGCVRLELG
jgi:hypothetical protein